MVNSQQLAIFDVQETLTRPYEINLLEVARQITAQLLRGQKLHPYPLRTWMNQEFNGTDADGIWQWKDAYEAQEVALVSLLNVLGKGLRGQPELNLLHRLLQLEQLTLTQTKRTEESVELQQFSTPLPLAYLAACCAQITPSDIVLEPSAGTGILAKFADLHGCHLVLNEWSDRRLAILQKLFSSKSIYSFNAEQIHDYLPPAIAPTVVLMNPPFTSSPNVHKRYPLATVKHIRSAFLRLAPGGRLVVMTAQWFAPSSKWWKALFQGLDADVRLTVNIAGHLYAKHGTTIDTRLTIIDKRSSSFSTVQDEQEVLVLDLPDLTDEPVMNLLKAIPSRWEAQIEVSLPVVRSPQPQQCSITQIDQSDSLIPSIEEAIEVHYQVVDSLPDASQLSDAIYEVYQPCRIRIEGSLPHPTTLCESVALASVSPPIPQYQPHLPQRVLSEGLLSEAQLESLIYAGEAHTHYLRGYYQVDEHFDTLSAAAAGDDQSVQFRRGWFLGDGTGAGKGRQIAGIILDNFLKGRTGSVLDMGKCERDNEGVAHLSCSP